jgi:hypothetical protein
MRLFKALARGLAISILSFASGSVSAELVITGKVTPNRRAAVPAFKLQETSHCIL